MPELKLVTSLDEYDLISSWSILAPPKLVDLLVPPAITDISTPNVWHFRLVRLARRPHRLCRDLDCRVSSQMATLC